MFASTLILGVTLPFIQKLHINAIDPSHDEDEAAHKLAIAMHSAKWTASTTLSLVLFNQAYIALLNRSLDRPRTLMVSNRYLRMFPRLLVVVIALCLPIDEAMSGVIYLGILSAILTPCLLWEWVVSLEYGGGLVEPNILS